MMKTMLWSVLLATMLALTIAFVDADTIRQEWQHSSKGKPAEKPAVLLCKRVQP